MPFATLLLFSLVALIAIATPGPTVLLALANGSRYGVRRSLPGMAGAVLSDFVLIGAVVLGLGALLAASEFWFSVVKWAGAAYLAFIGWRLLRSQGSAITARGAAEGTTGAVAHPRDIFAKSFLVAVTNPKGYLFCGALLPQFVDPSLPGAPQYLAIAVVFASLDFVVMLGYALLGARAVALLRRGAAKWIDRACGGVLLLLAGSLAIYRRAGS